MYIGRKGYRISCAFIYSSFLYPEVGILCSLSKRNSFHTNVINGIIMGNFVLFMKNSI